MKNQSLQNFSELHTPVMISEVIKFLNLQPDGIYLDGTIGAGGHATEILAQLSLEGKLIGLDRDAEALEICKSRFSASAHPILTYKTSYDDFPKILSQLGISKLNGISVSYTHLTLPTNREV